MVSSSSASISSLLDPRSCNFSDGRGFDVGGSGSSSNMLAILSRSHRSCFGRVCCVLSLIVSGSRFVFASLSPGLVLCFIGSFSNNVDVPISCLVTASFLLAR